MLDGLKSVVNEMTELDAEYKRKRDELVLRTTQLINDDNKTITQEVINYIYWESGISAEPLATALGIHVSSLSKKVAEYRMGIPCSNCGEDIFFTFKSKSEISTKKSEKNRYGIICPKCLKIEKEKEKAAEQKKRETQKLKRQNKIDKLCTMPYDEYLHTPHWRKTKKKAIQDADFMCSDCGRDNVPLDVHHKTYEHKGYEYPEDLQVVCRKCHEHIHGRKFPVNPLFVPT